MTRRGGRPAIVASVAVAVVAAVTLALAACDGAAPRPKAQPVKDLRLPTEAERESIEKVHEAEIFLDARKPRLAEAPLRRALELDPSNRRASELLARCLVERGEAAEAVPVLRTALGDSPRMVVFHALLVQALAKLGDHAGAAAAATAWTGVDEQSDEAWYQLGRAQYALGRTEEALASFRRAETLKPSRADVRSDLGLALAATGKLALAEAKQRDAAERQPDHAEAWFRLADVIFRRDPGRAGEAVEAMDRAVRLQPGNAEAHLHLFRFCRAANPADREALRARGEEAWRDVLKIHGRAQIAPLVAERPGEAGEASEFVLREKVSLHPEDPAPRLALARLLHGERRFVEAIEAYKRAVECGATDADTRLRLAAAYVGAEDVAAGEREAREAVKASPPSTGAAHRLLAWTLLVQGRDADARVEADAALAGAPDDVLAKKVRALARMRLGEVDAGLEEIEGLGGL